MDGRVLDRQHIFDAPVEVARHPVGRADVDLRCGVRQLVSVGEAPQPAMFEEPADDRLDVDILGKAGNAGPQAADAADDEVDLTRRPRSPRRACR